MLGVGLWFAFYSRVSGIPKPGSAFGLWLGTCGFLLMLATETLYTFRKRLKWFQWGATRRWLQFHIFTGIVGPFLVLLHTGGQYHGLAGVTAAFTVILVASGFLGRYVYTALPRGIDGQELDGQTIQERLDGIDESLRDCGLEPGHLKSPWDQVGMMGVLLRPLLQWRAWARRRQLAHAAARGSQRRAARIHHLLRERDRLVGQVRRVASARRLLAMWHLIHIPLGAALFTLAFLHIGAALYYGVFSR